MFRNNSTIKRVRHAGILALVSYEDRHKPSMTNSKPVDRTAHTGRSTVKDMGVTHCCLHVFVAHEFLDRPNIVPTFQQVRWTCVRSEDGSSKRSGR